MIFFDNYLLKDPLLKNTPRSDLEKGLISKRRALSCSAYSKSEDRSDNDKDPQKLKKKNITQRQSS